MYGKVTVRWMYFVLVLQSYPVNISLQNFLFHNYRIILKNVKPTPVGGSGGSTQLWDTVDLAFATQSAHWRRWGCQSYASTGRYPQKESWYTFLFKLSRPQGENATGRVRLIAKSSDFTRNLNWLFPVSSRVPQPTTACSSAITLSRNGRNMSLACSMHVRIKNTKSWE
jgi:hypothetical protein